MRLQQEKTHAYALLKVLFTHSFTLSFSLSLSLSIFDIFIWSMAWNAQIWLWQWIFQIIEFISVLVTASSEVAEKKIVRLGAVQRILELFFE